jgi:hypothetical protein
LRTGLLYHYLFFFCGFSLVFMRACVLTSLAGEPSSARHGLASLRAEQLLSLLRLRRVVGILFR